MGQISDNLLALNAAKHAIREAINAKGGGPLSKGAPLSAYPGAIGGIPSPGSSVDPDADVVFIDYDGTPLYSYSKEEFLALTELPENPSHEGLTARGWNWTLAGAKTYVQAYGGNIIGQMYEPTDGKIHIFITLRTSLAFSFTTVAGTVDWGDGSAPETVSSGGSHTYAAAGDYEIKISDCNRIGSNAFLQNGSITDVWVPGNVTISSSVFNTVRTLKTAVIAPGIAELGSGSFQYCANLRGFVIPNTITSLGQSDILNGATYLLYLSFPEASFNIGSYFFNQGGPMRVFIPSGIQRINTYLFYGYKRDAAVAVLPSEVNNIANTSFYSACIRVKCYATIPPTLSGGMNSSEYRNVVFYVPDESVAAYRAATNWSAAPEKIQPMSSFR